MRTYTWDEYYEKFYDWAESTQVRNLSALTSLGSADEVGEIIIELQVNVPASNRLLRKAVEEKLAFSGSDLAEFAYINDKEPVTAAVRNSAGRLTAEDMEYLYGDIDDEVIIEICKQRNILLPEALREEEEEDIDVREELVQRLLEYKKYKEMGKLLNKKEESAPLSIQKEASIPEEVERYCPPLDIEYLLKGIDLLRLRETMREIVRRKEDRKDTLRSNFGKIKREKISLEGKIKDVLAYAKAHGRFSFRQMLNNSKGRTETVVSFLAVLELMKMGKISLTQERAFSDLHIEVREGISAEDSENLDITGIEEFD